MDKILYGLVVLFRETLSAAYRVVHFVPYHVTDGLVLGYLQKKAEATIRLELNLSTDTVLTSRMYQVHMLVILQAMHL